MYKLAVKLFISSYNEANRLLTDILRVNATQVTTVWQNGGSHVNNIIVMVSWLLSGYHWCCLRVHIHLLTVAI